MFRNIARLIKKTALFLRRRRATFLDGHIAGLIGELKTARADASRANSKANLFERWLTESRMIYAGMRETLKNQGDVICERTQERDKAYKQIRVLIEQRHRLIAKIYWIATQHPELGYAEPLFEIPGSPKMKREDLLGHVA